MKLIAKRMMIHKIYPFCLIRGGHSVVSVKRCISHTNELYKEYIPRKCIACEHNYGGSCNRPELISDTFEGGFPGKWYDYGSCRVSGDGLLEEISYYNDLSNAGVTYHTKHKDKIEGITYSYLIPRKCANCKYFKPDSGFCYDGGCCMRKKSTSRKYSKGINLDYSEVPVNVIDRLYIEECRSELYSLSTIPEYAIR